MEVLDLHFNSTIKAYSKLEKILEKFQKAKVENHSEDDLMVYRDSAIKRFEICYDLTWKLLKIYLEKKHSIICQSPKKVFRECFKLNLYNEEEAHQFLNMVDDRNLTSHTYSESSAQEISERILDYLILMKKVLQEVNCNKF